MINKQDWVKEQVAEIGRRFRALPIPPFIKLGALIVVGITPFAFFVALQSKNTPQQSTGETSTQPIGDERVPLVFAFGTPEPSPLPTPAESTTAATGPTSTTKPATPAPAQCADGKDNDKDGKIDLADSGCSSKSDRTEATAMVTTHAPPPPTVATTTAPPPTQPPTTTAPPPATTAPPPATTEPEQETTRATTTPRTALGECSDGIDNDNDGKIDLADKASCHGDPADDE